jgi:hypothetical protein
MKFSGGGVHELVQLGSDAVVVKVPADETSFLTNSGRWTATTSAC